MNLADAIRKAADGTFGTQSEPQASQRAAKPADKPKPQRAPKPKLQGAAQPANEAAFKDWDDGMAYDAVTEEPVRTPDPPTVQPQTGNVVRLELFLSPEQLNGLFRAFLSTQHSMMTLREAAAYLRVHPSALERMAQDGDVPAILIDGRWRFPKTNLDEWLTLQAFRSGGESNAA
jgi:excisionase family DNA binding protein